VKLKRILALPLAVAADAVTLGNFGQRMFTQQVFDAERREQNDRNAERAVRLAIALIRATNGR
jgi:hypothetical protein